MSRRSEIEAHAATAFESHVLTVVCRDDKGEPYAWRCNKAGTGIYGFWVMIGPGCIAQWGDVGGLMIAEGHNYTLGWLRGAAHSMDYVMSKTRLQRTQYVREMFLERLADYRKDMVESEKEFKFELVYDGGEEDWRAFVEQTNEYEYEVHDYTGDQLWGYYALVKFIALYEKEVADVEAAVPPTG